MRERERVTRERPPRAAIHGVSTVLGLDAERVPHRAIERLERQGDRIVLQPAVSSRLPAEAIG